MSKALSRAFHLSQTGAAIRFFPYQYGTIRSHSGGKLDSTIVTKINKDFKDIYEFLRRPELHKGDLKFKKDDHSGIAYITLDFPQKRNAMSGSMMADLWDAVQELSRWNNGRAVILRGANGIFCSGADMDFVRHRAVFSHEGGRRMSLFMSTTLAALRALPLTSVALVEKAAIGGGAELAGATDFRVFTEDTIAQYVQATLSIIPGWGGVARLVALVGPTRALELLQSGRRLTAREGLQIGYVQHIIPKSQSQPTSTATTTLASTSTSTESSKVPTSTTTSTTTAPEALILPKVKAPKPSPHQATGVDPALAACVAWLDSIVGGARRPDVVRAVKSTVHAAAETALPIDGAPLQLDEIARFTPMCATPAHRESIQEAMRAIQSKSKPKPNK